ncbi:MAG: cytochrome C oxidase subunit IV family protein [Bdellovibrionota bacterium]
MANNHSHSHNSHSNTQEHHVTPFSLYIKVAGALYVLTVMTVAGHLMHLGAFAAPVAFIIAAVKAYLVMWFFMHLNHDRPMNRLIFATGFFFLGLLFIICATDIWTRVAQTSTL